MIAIPLLFFERTAILSIVHTDLFSDETDLNEIFILEYMVY